MTSESEHSRSSFEENSSFPGDQLEEHDVCEELLGSKMSALELNDVCMKRQQQQHQSQFCDGSDSGVDIATTMSISLQRALSNNSGGYASSTCGGLDETTSVCYLNGGNMSCDSSMISYSSDLCELKAAAAVAAAVAANTELGHTHNGNSNYECCSENGSESSSVAGGASQVGGRGKLMNSIKKKVAMFEPHVTPPGRMTRDKEPNAPANANSTTIAGQLNGSGSRMRSRLSGITRTASLTRHAAAAPMLQTRERARSREKSVMPPNQKPTATAFRATQTRVKPQKPDSLPATLNSHVTPNIQQQRIMQRTPSLSRARTPGTPSDDGRWPSLGIRSTGMTKPQQRGLSATPDLASMKLRANMLLEVKAGVCSPYGTMPRRRKQKSVEDLTGRSSRSSSTSRDPFANPRMVSSVVLSSRKSLASTYGTPTSTRMLPGGNLTSLSASKTSLATRKCAQPKTKIYHETSVQTAITNQDLEKILTGAAPLAVAIDAAEFRDSQTQCDIRDKQLERLRDELRQLSERENELTNALAERTQRSAQLEQQLKKEREEKLAIQRELHLNTERVIGMLELARVSGTPTDDDEQCDSLLMLESQIQMSGHELHEKQQEIGKLRQLCRTLQTEMERSMLTQVSLLQEKVAIEQESNELHDFLQHEKAAMCDALKEMELEHETYKRQLENKEEEIKVLRDECRHLVRLNEQRRQENRLMQTKYSALESKSKELIVQQNASVSGASMSLTGLQSRLDSLVEQLVSSYSISEQDLEDIVFQNELSTNGSNSLHDNENSQNVTNTMVHSGVDSSYQPTSDGSLSPQRNQSFIAAVISAIRHATTPSGKKLLSRCKKPGTQEHTTNGGEESDSTTEMLDSETEPCLMMDNVLEDVTMPDSHSHNMVSSTCTGAAVLSQIEPPSELVNAAGDESLQNLSQAITNRQQMELQINTKLPLQFSKQRENSLSEDVSCHDSVAEMPSLVDYCGSGQSIVDEVIEVENIVTKLLKVLRLIQMDNDSCIQQLILDKNKLQQNKEDMLEKLKDLQDVNVQLKDELMDATQELMLKSNDLSSTKAEMQRHRNEIDRLTQDICNLSTLCSNYKKLSPTTESPAQLPSDLVDDRCEVSILNLLKMWQQEGQFAAPEVRDYLQDVMQCDLNPTEECNANRLTPSNSSDCLRLYAQQMESVLQNLQDLQSTQLQQQPALQALHKDMEDVRLRLRWLSASNSAADAADNLNANDVVRKNTDTLSTDAALCK